MKNLDDYLNVLFSMIDNGSSLLTISKFISNNREDLILLVKDKPEYFGLADWRHETDRLIYLQVPIISNNRSGEEWDDHFKRTDKSISEEFRQMLHSEDFIKSDRIEKKVVIMREDFFDEEIDPHGLEKTRYRYLSAASDVAKQFAKDKNGSEINLEAMCLIRDVFGDFTLELIGIGQMMIRSNNGKLIDAFEMEHKTENEKAAFAFIVP